ncbi:unnamed protein product [Orchesella dallaii]|uniref:Uncharacterized protein n=1 Tax=Orchesella dallaii TaxID=48710 RepID=A0ABP1QLR4_9HEXA
MTKTNKNETEQEKQFFLEKLVNLPNEEELKNERYPILSREENIIRNPGIRSGLGPLAAVFVTLEVVSLEE